MAIPLGATMLNDAPQNHRPARRIAGAVMVAGPTLQQCRVRYLIAGNGAWVAFGVDRLSLPGSAVWIFLLLSVVGLRTNLKEGREMKLRELISVAVPDTAVPGSRLARDPGLRDSGLAVAAATGERSADDGSFHSGGDSRCRQW